MDPLSEVSFRSLISPELHLRRISLSLTTSPSASPSTPASSATPCSPASAGSSSKASPTPSASSAGDCFLLPRGLPFRLTTDLALAPILYTEAFARAPTSSRATPGDHPDRPLSSPAATSPSPAATPRCSFNRSRPSSTSAESPTAPPCAGPSSACTKSSQRRSPAAHSSRSNSPT